MDPRVSQLQDAILRAMTPTEKVAVAEGLRRTAWQFKAAGVRLAHPDWSEQQVQARVREIFANAGA